MHLLVYSASWPWCVAEEDVVGVYVYQLCSLTGSFADGSWETAGEDGGEESAEAGEQPERCGSRHSLLTQ